MDCVRRFLREDLQQGMDKLLHTGATARGYLDEDAAFDALQLLVLLAASMLEYRQQQSADVLAELDSDMAPLMIVVMGAFNANRPLHVRAEYLEVPAQVAARYGLEANDEVQWVQPKLDEPTWIQLLQDDDMDDIQDELQEKNQWWSYIIQTFGNMRGFEIIIEVGGGVTVGVNVQLMGSVPQLQGGGSSSCA